MEEKDSLLANLLASETEKVREEIILTPIQDLLRNSLEEVGLYVYSSELDHVNGNEFAGSIRVATDGMPERAKAAVEEILRSQNIEEFYWTEYSIPGQVCVTWEVLDDE